MCALIGTVQHQYHCLQALLEELGPQHELSRQNIDNLLLAFDADFDLEGGLPKGRSPNALSHEQLRKKVRYEQGQRRKAEEECQQLKAEKLQGKVHNV